MSEPTSNATLTGRMRQHLRGLGHHLKATVFVGKSGISESVIKGTMQALDGHELIKIRFTDGFGPSVDSGASELAEKTGSAVAGRVGRTALIYRRDDEKPKIVLPASD